MVRNPLSPQIKKAPVIWGFFFVNQSLRFFLNFGKSLKMGGDWD
jgi:hypothetical protein